MGRAQWGQITSTQPKARLLALLTAPGAWGEKTQTAGAGTAGAAQVLLYLLSISPPALSSMVTIDNLYVGLWLPGHMS